MKKQEIIKDIICQVLAKSKSKELIYSVLNEFLPNYQSINIDYTGKHDDENYVFKSEDEMISYYVNTPNLNQIFYWNKQENNPDNIMVGANILTDNQIVFSLTFDGSQQMATQYLTKLESLLESSISVISYINPVEYADGKDFENKYSSK